MGAQGITSDGLKVTLGDDVLNVPEVTHDVWVVSASANNAQVSATKAAQSGKSHYVKAIFASYSAAPGNFKNLKLMEGAAEKLRYVVSDRGYVDLYGLKITANTAVSAQLQASGTGGVNGYVSVLGYTA